MNKQILLINNEWEKYKNLGENRIKKIYIYIQFKYNIINIKLLLYI